MPDIKWIKITTEMFDDDKINIIEQMPDADTILIIWIKLLTLAGKKNAGGWIYLTEKLTYTDEMLATIFHRNLATVRLALATFQKFGMIEVVDDHGIFITNWEKHQNIEGLEKIRRLTKERTQKYRSRLKQQSSLQLPQFASTNSDLQPCDVTVTSCDAIDKNKIRIREEEEYKEEELLSSLSDKLNVFVLFENEIGKLTELTRQDITDSCTEYSEEWVIEAIKEASRSQHKNWRYILGILENWKIAGKNTSRPHIANTGGDPDKFIKGRYGHLFQR